MEGPVPAAAADAARRQAGRDRLTEVAYLNTQYPGFSHTFIEREVNSVRDHGVKVRTFSIRKPEAVSRMGRANEDAARETEYVLDGVAIMVLAQLRALVTRPLGVVRTLVAAQRLSPGGVVERLRHAVYAMEAIRLAQMLARRSIRHVHVHMANNGAMVALLACRFDPRLRYSLSIHGSAEFFDVHRLRLGAKAEGAVFVRCISNFCRAQVMAWSPPASWDRFEVVRTGVDTSRFRPPETRPHDRLRIVTVGRLVPIKGYHVLLLACAEMAKKGVAFSLDVVGDGPLRGPLEHRARELSIDGSVTFSGPVSQDVMRQHLDRANVMVVSSFMEGVPVVLMEAMATGLAVVATRVGGIVELVEHESNGLLVDPSSPSALADALQRLASDEPLRRSFGRAGRETVCARYELRDSGAAMAELLQRREGTAPA